MKWNLDIVDTCPCGATITVKGDNADIQHKAWLVAHKICRQQLTKGKGE